MKRNANQNPSSSSVGIGFVGVLTALFIALKLTGYITWSWWWVLAPMWGSLAVGIAVVALAIIIVAIKKG